MWTIRTIGLIAVFLCTATVNSSDWLLSLAQDVTVEAYRDIGAFNTAPIIATSSVVYPEAVVFTGDIMLGRHVERLANQNGDHYSFGTLNTIVRPSDVVVANFEASIPARHIPTPDFTMRFSVPFRLAALLPEYNITYVSLANNHAYDFGSEGFTQTQTVLNEAGITGFGHPSQVASSSVAYIDVADARVAVIGLHTLYTTPTARELSDIFARAAADSDWQVAYVHWGEEYDLTHSDAQAQFASQLVAAGADVIIGHHPHVVQDVSMIGEVPVFYSLGNFIFDQYFSTAVQTGLALRLQFTTDTINYELLPVTAMRSPAKPRLMTMSEQELFLADLRQRSAITSRQQLALGMIPSRLLATSTQISIMTE